MYHGEEVPGFPQHPHRGFETITATLSGIIDHSDSMGNAGRYGEGDVQWMTAGAGVVHGEMFPLTNTKGPNPLRFFQIWLNLPAKHKMADPEFVMHWAHLVPKVEADGVVARVWAGAINGTKALDPCCKSWAMEEENELGIWHVKVPPGKSMALPATGADTNRNVYYIEGEAAVVAGRAFKDVRVIVTTAGGAEVTLAVPGSATVASEFLILQGKPIGEPVVQHGPFVMNTDAEIKQAFADYRRDQFGGWPWPEDAMTFGDKGRFALQGGVETTP